MIKQLLSFTLLLITLQNFAQVQHRVAQFSTGTNGTKAYESLSFWTEKGKPAFINYSYGTAPKELKVKNAGTIQHNGDTCLKIQFSNQYILFVSIAGKKIKVTDAGGKYNKIFSWEYEGPVNGVGTFCDVCAQDEDEAIQLLRNWFK